MATETQLLYLEPDDEITSVVRRLREADAGRVVLVAPGRSKVTTSAVALRLLAGEAAEQGREIALVADAAGRALAGEAGIAAFAAVTEASVEGATPLESPPARRAPIRVVRGETTGIPAAPPPLDAERLPRPAAPGPGDETQAVPIPPPSPPGSRRVAPRPRPGGAAGRRLPRAVVGALVALILLSAGGVAALAPSATISIQPVSLAMEPVAYTLSLPPAGVESGELNAEAQGTATGIFTDPSPASGTVVFLNWTYVTVEIPAGTRVSASSEIFFQTVERVVAPPGSLAGFQITPGQVSVGVIAEAPGPSGNVEAEAIDTIENRNVDRFLQGFPGQTGRRVVNPDPTSGGAENSQPEVTQADVDAAIQAVRDDLAAQLQDALADDPKRLYGPRDAGEPSIEVPEGLVGLRGEESFTLAGSLSYARPYLEREEVLAAARERLLSDADATVGGREIVPETIEVDVGAVTHDGEDLAVEVTLRGETVPIIEPEAIRELAAGLTPDEAEAALAPLGDVAVALWPGWVDRVPRLLWRIEVDVRAEPDASRSPAS